MARRNAPKRFSAPVLRSSPATEDGKAGFASAQFRFDTPLLEAGSLILLDRQPPLKRHILIAPWPKAGVNRYLTAVNSSEDTTAKKDQ